MFIDDIEIIVVRGWKEVYNDVYEKEKIEKSIKQCVAKFKICLKCKSVWRKNASNND